MKCPSDGKTCGAGWRNQVFRLGSKSKGLNTKYGFHNNRPFYFVSRMPMKRVAECHGANNIWLRRYRKNVAAQQFFFDPVSKTLRSQQWKNYALAIQSNGGS